MAIHSHRDLIVWRRGIELVDGIYEATGRYPSDQRFVLTSQTRRAAISIPANVAEGFARGPLLEYLRFLSIASGSCAELDTHLVIATRRGYLTDGESTHLVDGVSQIGRMLTGLRSSLRRRRQRPQAPGPRP